MTGRVTSRLASGLALSQFCGPHRDAGDALMTSVDDAAAMTPESNAARSLLRDLVAAFGSLRAAPDVDRALDALAESAAAQLGARAWRRRARFEILPREALPQHADDVGIALRALQGDVGAARAVRAKVESLVIGRIHARGLGAHEHELLGLIMSRVWDKLSLYHGKASLQTWAWRVTDNFLRNWIRDQRVQARHLVPLDGADGAGVNSEHFAATPAFDADSPILADEHARRARVLVARVTQVAEQRIADKRLKPSDWNLVLQVVVNGEHYDVLAQEYGTSPGALRVRVFRVLEGLRQSLRDAMGDDVHALFTDKE